MPGFLRRLALRPGLEEIAIVSTCNRTELVGIGPSADAAELEAIEFLLERLRSGPEMRRHLYTFRGEAALRHLFRVTASLDSLVVGEPQILGQVKQAFKVASEQHTLGPHLRRVFDKVFSVAKRVRSRTKIGAS